MSENAPILLQYYSILSSSHKCQRLHKIQESGESGSLGYILLPILNDSQIYAAKASSLPIHILFHHIAFSQGRHLQPGHIYQQHIEPAFWKDECLCQVTKCIYANMWINPTSAQPHPRPHHLQTQVGLQIGFHMGLRSG